MIKKDVYFSIAEEEIIEALKSEYNITHIEAVEQVLGQKRQAAFAYAMSGNFDVGEQLLREINEWNDEVEQDFINRGREIPKSQKIVLPTDPDF